MMTGRACFTVLVSFVLLSRLLRDGGAITCTETKPQLRELGDRVSQLSECILECSGMTYFKKLQLQDKRTIKFQVPTEGDFGEYCWSKELNCSVGESFQHAYALLPADTSAVGHQMLEVKATGPTVTRLQVHDGPTTVAESCGYLYEVTWLFSAEDAGTSVCLQVTTNNDIQEHPVLKCPPYLVTFWQRNHPDRQEDGG
ncbi:uncharacterized protein [Takifugu rubripes]|uniref:uncharacterized protein n=1 Tax=Takifugu rubripes TaxID=31033 RepID=UPI001145526B|nr:uncharacterized protein LOC115250214 [Takifugu rubripes]